IAIHCEGKLVYVNDASVKFVKAKSKDDLLGKQAINFVHPSSVVLVNKRIRDMLTKNIMVPFAEETFMDVEGNAIEVETAAIATTFRGKPAIQVIVRDISERKKREEQVKASLYEKEILLKEIHHRVKNNLQIISSLLNLQSEQIEDERALALFNDSRNRVKSMALIHERLYQSHDLAHVDFAEYINELSRFLYRTYVTNEQRVGINVDTENIFLAIDTAIPCGLIINELLSNALKYAFPDSDDGLVEVKFKNAEGDRFELIVQDNGVGLPSDLDFRNTSSLGLQLVVSLVQQIKGEIELDRSCGSRFTVKFSAK
ncbi:MAG: sensor histidine kinase, partial [Syntrophothermus sp.]